MKAEQIRQLLTDAPEEYIKVYEDRFKKVARKAFTDGMMVMADFVDCDGDFQLKWSDDTFRAIKLANDIDNAAGFPLSLSQYQEKAMSTCMESCNNFSYMMLNLMGEIGEFTGKIAKGIRRYDIMADYNSVIFYGKEDERKAAELELKKEAGDILWQLAGLCRVMGWDLEDVAMLNLEKLSSRRDRGVIDGEGDNR